MQRPKTIARALIAASWAQLALLLASPAALGADEPVGAIPAWAFGEPGGAPSLAVGTINDSNCVGLGLEEWDDYRSFGFRASAGAGSLALSAALDSITFRGATAAEARRIEEASLGAGWRGPRLEASSFALGARLGAGLRIWGDLGLAAIQESWHGLLGTTRDIPLEYIDAPAAEPFAWAALDLSRRGGLDLEASATALATLSGAVETSLRLEASRSAGFSADFLYIRREDRLGSPNEPESRLASVEAGTWIGWGARSGFLRFENSANLDAAYSSCTVTLGSPPAPRRRRGPPEELVIGTSLLEPEFAVYRLLVLGDGPELHIGVAQRVGTCRIAPEEGCDSHFQELGLVLELFLRRPGGRAALVPFAGLELGARLDSWYAPVLQRVAVLGESTAATAALSLGLRLDSAFLDPPAPWRLALDLVAGWSGASRAYPEPGPLLSLRVAVLDY